MNKPVAGLLPLYLELYDQVVPEKSGGGSFCWNDPG
jgi:hypothetical protein